MIKTVFSVYKRVKSRPKTVNEFVLKKSGDMYCIIAKYGAFGSAKIADFTDLATAKEKFEELKNIRRTV